MTRSAPRIVAVLLVVSLALPAPSFALREQQEEHPLQLAGLESALRNPEKGPILPFKPAPALPQPAGMEEVTLRVERNPPIEFPKVHSPTGFALDPPSDTLFAIDTTPQRTLGWRSNDQLRAFNIRTGKPKKLRIADLDVASAVVFDSTTQDFFITEKTTPYQLSQKPRLRAFNAKTGLPTGMTIEGLDHDPKQVAYDPVGGRLFIVGTESAGVDWVTQRIRSYDARTGRPTGMEIRFLESDHHPRAVAHDPITNSLFIADRFSLRSYDARTGKPMGLEISGLAPVGIAYDPDLRLLFVLEHHETRAIHINRIGAFDARTGKPVDLQMGNLGLDQPVALLYDPTAKILFAVESPDRIRLRLHPFQVLHLPTTAGMEEERPERLDYRIWFDTLGHRGNIRRALKRFVRSDQKVVRGQVNRFIKRLDEKRMTFFGTADYLVDLMDYALPAAIDAMTPEQLGASLALAHRLLDKGIYPLHTLEQLSSVARVTTPEQFSQALTRVHLLVDQGKDPWLYLLGLAAVASADPDPRTYRRNVRRLERLIDDATTLRYLKSLAKSLTPNQFSFGLSFLARQSMKAREVCCMVFSAVATNSRSFARYRSNLLLLGEFLAEDFPSFLIESEDSRRSFAYHLKESAGFLSREEFTSTLEFALQLPKGRGVHGYSDISSAVKILRSEPYRLGVKEIFDFLRSWWLRLSYSFDRLSPLATVSSTLKELESNIQTVEEIFSRYSQFLMEHRVVGELIPSLSQSDITHLVWLVAKRSYNSSGFQRLLRDFIETVPVVDALLKEELDPKKEYARVYAQRLGEGGGPMVYAYLVLKAADFRRYGIPYTLRYVPPKYLYGPAYDYETGEIRKDAAGRDVLILVGVEPMILELIPQPQAAPVPSGSGQAGMEENTMRASHVFNHLVPYFRRWKSGRLDYTTVDGIGVSTPIADERNLGIQVAWALNEMGRGFDDSVRVVIGEKDRTAYLYKPWEMGHIRHGPDTAAGLEERPERSGILARAVTVGAWGPTNKALEKLVERTQLDTSAQRSLRWQINGIVRRLAKRWALRAARLTLQVGVPAVANASPTLQSARSNLEALDELMTQLSASQELDWSKVEPEAYLEGFQWVVMKALLLHRAGSGFVAKVVPEQGRWAEKPIYEQGYHWLEGSYTTNVIVGYERVYVVDRPQQILLVASQADLATSIEAMISQFRNWSIPSATVEAILRLSPTSEVFQASFRMLENYLSTKEGKRHLDYIRIQQLPRLAETNSTSEGFQDDFQALVEFLEFSQKWWELDYSDLWEDAFQEIKKSSPTLASFQASLLALDELFTRNESSQSEKKLNRSTLNHGLKAVSLWSENPEDFRLGLSVLENLVTKLMGLRGSLLIRREDFGSLTTQVLQLRRQGIVDYLVERIPWEDYRDSAFFEFYPDPKERYDQFRIVPISEPPAPPLGSSQGGLEEPTAVVPVEVQAAPSMERLVPQLVAQVPSEGQITRPMRFIVDTNRVASGKGDPRVMRLLQLAISLWLESPELGELVEVAGVATAEELAAAQAELPNPLTRRLLEAVTYVYRPGDEDDHRRALGEARVRVPGFHPELIITEINRATIRWFFEALRRLGIRHLGRELRLRIHELITAA